MLGETGGIRAQKWPAVREDLAKDDQIELIVQINGKVRAKMLVPAGLDENATKERAFADSKVKALLEGKQIVKVIVVPDKLVNVVVR